MPKSEPKYTAPECASCKGDLGGCVPFTADGETFCPQCFVYVRAPKEPERFYGGGFTPIACLGCSKKSVAVGPVACGQCGSRSVLVLPPAV